MNTREAFREALKCYIAPDNLNAAQELHRLCGVVWNDTAAMPIDDRHNVRDAIGSWLTADDWEAKGRTYAGAARRIRPTLTTPSSQPKKLPMTQKAMI